MPGKLQIEARWGTPFWQLVKDFADQGLSRFDTARALGYRPDSFCSMLCRNPCKDPFEGSNLPLAYLKATGEPFKEAVQRLAASGMLVSEVARTIGYRDAKGLRTALRVRGIEVQFSPRQNKRKPRPREPGIYRGWPTWEQVYQMGKNNGPV